MLRITHATLPAGPPVLRLEGKLVGPWVGELARVCAELPPGPALDLAAVTYLDRAGLALVRTLLDRGATLAACSSLAAALLEEET
jgi:hypothetical protein